MPRSQVRPLVRRTGTGALGAVALLLATTGSALAAPKAVITVPAHVHPGEPALLSARDSVPDAGASISGYEWDFDGSGYHASGSSTYRAFPAGQSSVVKLRVTQDQQGGTALSDETSVTIVPSPAPRATVAYASSASGTSASFTGAAGGTFECQLDFGPWAPCASPVSSAGLSPGQHPFAVREVAPSGEVQSPATPASLFAPFPLPVSPPVSFPTYPTYPTTVPIPAPVRQVVPRLPKVPVTRPGRTPAARVYPSGSMLHVHVGPKDVITPDDVRLGIRKGKKYGCEDVNPRHPENVSHCGWPVITGMFFNTGETRCDVCPTHHKAKLTIVGTPNLNDELLGGTDDVVILAGNGNNVLWADRVPGGPKGQVAKITAGNGNNIVYAGPGTNIITLGSGRNVVHAWQGRGSVTCASKKTVVRMMDRSRKRYKIRGCSTKKGY